MRLLLVMVLLAFCFSSSAQNPDSLSRSIDSSAQKIERSFKSLEDSLQQIRIEQAIQKKGVELNEFLADYEEREKAAERQTYIRIGLGLAFIAALFYGFTRRRKKGKISA